MQQSVVVVVVIIIVVVVVVIIIVVVVFFYNCSCPPFSILVINIFCCFNLILNNILRQFHFLSLSLSLYLSYISI